MKTKIHFKTLMTFLVVVGYIASGFLISPWIIMVPLIAVVAILLGCLLVGAYDIIYDFWEDKEIFRLRESKGYHDDDV